MKALFLSNCLHHRKHYDRLESLLKAGFEVAVIGYNWRHGVTIEKNIHENKNVSLYPVKKIQQSNLFTRLMQWPTFILKMFTSGAVLKKYDLVLCNTFEMCLFAYFLRVGGKRKIFDLADLNPVQTNKGVIGKIANFIEKNCIAKTFEYIVTSPWFYWDFIIKDLQVKPICYLVENKVTDQIDNEQVLPEFNSDQQIILWNGVLRCNKSLQVLEEIVKQCAGKVRVRMAGNISQINTEIMNRILKNPLFEFVGPYDDDKLSEIYKDVNWVWVSDMTPSRNGKLLLPNRIYHSIYMGRPALAAGEGVIPSYIEYKAIGISCNSEDVTKVASAISSNLLAINKDAFANIVRVVNANKQNAIRKDELIKIFIGTYKYPLPTILDLEYLLN